MITDKLLQIEKYLFEINAPVLNFLRKGVENNDFESILNFYNETFYLSDEVKSIFRWHNGTYVDSELTLENFYLFPTYFLISLDEIRILLKQNSLQIVENNMFPIFSSGNGDLLTISLKSGEKSKVFCVQPWNPNKEMFIPIYDCLEEMFDTILTCYKKRFFYLLKGNLLEMNFDKAWDLSKKMNPNSKFWED